MQQSALRTRLTASCFAMQAGSTFFNVSSADLVTKWLGEGEKLVGTGPIFLSNGDVTCLWCFLHSRADRS